MRVTPEEAKRIMNVNSERIAFIRMHIKGLTAKMDCLKKYGLDTREVNDEYIRVMEQRSIAKDVMECLINMDDRLNEISSRALGGGAAGEIRRY